MDTLIGLLLRRDEGFRRSAYTDSLGFLTIGIGRCIDAKKGAGVSLSEAEYLLGNDIADRETALSALFPWWSTLDEARRAVLLSMAFQLGVRGVTGFRKTLAAVAEGRWGDAADSMMASRWASQTPLRASRLAQTMRSGDRGALQLDEDPPRL